MSRVIETVTDALRHVGALLLVGLVTACGSEPEAAMPMEEGGMDMEMGEMDHS